MKILLLIPEKYTILNTFKNAFEDLEHQVTYIDYHNCFPKWQNRIITKTIGLPRRIKDKIKIHKHYRKEINRKYLEAVYSYKPDLVLVYNDQYLNYKTALEIKNISKLAFILGDNPFFFHNHPSDELGMYLNADFVFSADSFITESFKKAGLKNADQIYLGYDPSICYTKEPTNEEKLKYTKDVVMIGRLYPSILSSWTYKRLWFYHQFRKLDLKIYGHGWNKYKNDFPELFRKVVNPDHYLPFDEVNTILSCCKVYPIDANPGIINGIHLRVFDCIGTGILPVAEHTKDLDKVFDEVKVPSIKNYNHAASIVDEFIQNDSLRERRVNELKEFTNSRFTPKKTVNKILNMVFN